MTNETVMTKRPTTPEDRQTIHPSVARIIMRHFKQQGYWVSELMPIDNKLFAVLVNGWFAVGVVTLERHVEFLFKTKMP